MVQLSAVKFAVQEVHHPSVCRHVPVLQLGEQTWIQLVPKYPFSQARGYNTQKYLRYYIRSRLNGKLTHVYETIIKYLESDNKIMTQSLLKYS